MLIRKSLGCRLVCFERYEGGFPIKETLIYSLVRLTVSSAILVDSAILLEPSESVCVPARSLVRSLLSPYGSELRDLPA